MTTEPNLEAMRKDLLEKDSEHGERMLKLNTLVAFERIAIANIAATTHAIDALSGSDSAPLLNALRVLERHAQRLDVLDKLAATFAGRDDAPRRAADSDVGNWQSNGRQLATAGVQ